MTKVLYTPSEVKIERKRLFDIQKGVDPILKQKLDFDESVCDHDHTTQYCRAALHRQTNVFEGLVFNAYRRCLQWVTDKQLSDILRNLADYLDTDYSCNAIHANWQKKVFVWFNKLTANQQNEVLKTLGKQVGKNPAERKKYFKQVVLDRSLGYNTIRSTIERIKNV